MVKLGSTVVLALLACAQARSMLRASTTNGELLASNLDLSVVSSSENDRAVILDGTPLLEFAKKPADDEEADAGADGDEDGAAKKKKKKKKAKKAADDEETPADGEEDAAPAKKKKGKKAKKADDAEDADAVAGGEEDAPKKKKKGKKGKKGADADAPEVDAGGDEEEAPKKKKGKKGKKGKKADDEEGADVTEDATEPEADADALTNSTANATAVIDPATGLPVTTPFPDAALNGTAPADATDATAAAVAATNTTATPAEPVNTTVTVNDDGSLDAVTSVPAAPTRPVEDEFPTSPDCHPEALPEAKIMNDDKVCKTELPRFYDATTGLNFDDRKDADKVKLMDKFCKSTCGNKYTQYVLAARKLDLTCAPSIQQLLVQASDKAQASRDEAINHQGEDTGKKALEPPKNSIVGKKKEEKPKKAEAKKDGKKPKKTDDDVDDDDELEHVFGNDDKKKVDDVTYFGGITRAMGAGTYKPTGHYPGLTLGCLKAEDGRYCAIKKAAMNDKHDGCQFYKSCCFGEYLAGLQNTDKVIATIEKKCPGSKAFAAKLCKH